MCLRIAESGFHPDSEIFTVQCSGKWILWQEGLLGGPWSALMVQYEGPT